MKYLFILTSLLCFHFTLYAQKICVDRMESDGSHQIMTDSKKYKIDDAEYSICLKVYETRNTLDWCLVLSSFYYIPRQSEVLLKLGNDSIIYLPVNNVHVGKVTLPGSSYVIGSVVSSFPSTEADYYSSLYALNESDLDNIEKNGIKKIRVSNGVKYRDKDFPSNSLGKFLTKSRRNIIERLNNPLKKKSLFDDF